MQRRDFVILTASADKTAKLWDAASGKREKDVREVKWTRSIWVLL
jgi:WD40 repeat protein